jgi:hypothetical protein
MIRSIDGKNYKGRQIRMNEADGGFQKPSPHGRKRIPISESR